MIGGQFENGQFGTAMNIPADLLGTAFHGQHDGNTEFATLFGGNVDLRQDLVLKRGGIAALLPDEGKRR